MDPPAPFAPGATRRFRPQVRVGVGVIIIVPNTNKIWAGIRKGSHGEGSLALPGGHLEMYESWEHCAQREVKEEVNLDITDIQFGHVTNDPMKEEEKHYVTIFVMARQLDPLATPENMEPRKCEGWQAYSWDELKELSKTGKLFGPLQRLVSDEPSLVLAFLNKDT